MIIRICTYGDAALTMAARSRDDASAGRGEVTAGAGVNGSESEFMRTPMGP